MLKKMPAKALPRMIAVCAFTAMLAISLFSLRISSIVLLLTAGLVSLTVFLFGKPAEGGAK
jgi:chromate transporter